MEPSARSLILDLLSTIGGRSAPVRALVAGGTVFGIAENALRVALARLLSEGLVERDERGRYRLGAGAAGVSQQLGSWRRIDAGLRRWTGAWLAVHSAGLPRGSALARRRRARALRFLGFRALAPGLEVRPDNLEGGAARARERLGALGLEAEALVYALDGLDAVTDRRARGLWDAAALTRGYRETRRRLEQSAAGLGALPRAAAMAESFRVGGDAIRQLVLDPLLPDEIVPVVDRRALIEALRVYDRRGREVWRGWLGGELPEPDACPAGVQGISAASDVLRAASGG